MTPHINAKKEDIAKVVLMPGDPLRAKYIAETYLKNAKQVNKVRNMFMYTGEYNGIRVTIAASGMGLPSIGIYSYELFKFYDVDTIIRIGTCASYTKELHVNDVVCIDSCYSESPFAKVAGNFDTDTMYATKEVNAAIVKAGQDLGIKVHSDIKGHSGEVFYEYDPDSYKTLLKTKNTKVVEMESFALFTNAKVLNKKAACLITVSDAFEEPDYQLSIMDRERNLNNMIKIGLKALLNLVK